MNDKKTLLCQLEPNIRLTASEECFILQVKEGNKWKNFYYTWIGDALKAYILLSLRKLGDTGEIKDLVEKIESLDTSIKEIDTDMTDAWREYANDPIEAATND